MGFQLVFDTAVSAVILQAGGQLDESDNVLISSVFGLLANKHINGRSAFVAGDELVKVPFRV